MGRRLGLATGAQISVCKLSFLSADTAVSVFCAKTVQQRPLLSREVETRLEACGVAHYVRIDHVSRLPVINTIQHTPSFNAHNLRAFAISVSDCCYIFFINSRRFYLNNCCELNQCFLHVWHGIDQTVIDNAIDEWHGRLCACVRATDKTLRATIVIIFSHMTTHISVV